MCACVLLRVWLSREWLRLRVRGRPLALFVARVGVERVAVESALESRGGARWSASVRSQRMWRNFVGTIV